MSDLKSLIEEIKETQKAADFVLENAERATRPGLTAAKNAATAKLPNLKNSYKESLIKSSFMIITTGNLAQEFAELAKKSGAVVVDCNKAYKSTVDRCEASLGRDRLFGLTQHQIVMSELRMIASEKDVQVKLPQPNLNDTKCDSKSDVENMVKNTIKSSNGLNLVKMDVEDQAVNQALELGLDSKVIPVVVLNAAPEEQQDLLNQLFRGKGLLLNTDEKEEVNQQLVVKTFEQIKKSLKGN